MNELYLKATCPLVEETIGIEGRETETDREIIRGCGTVSQTCVDVQRQTTKKRKLGTAGTQDRFGQTTKKVGQTCNHVNMVTPKRTQLIKPS